MEYCIVVRSLYVYVLRITFGMPKKIIFIFKHVNCSFVQFLSHQYIVLLYFTANTRGAKKTLIIWEKNYHLEERGYISKMGSDNTNPLGSAQVNQITVALYLAAIVCNAL